MPLNDPAAPVSGVRNPAARALLNGTPIAGLEQVTVRQTAYYQPDTFSADVAIDSDPSFDMAWWSNQDTIQVEIQLALPAPGQSPAWKTLIIGNVDRLDFEPTTRTVHIHGRDLGGLLQDTRTLETFVNQSAAEAAQTLAARHGLSCNASSSGLVGQYYELEHSSQALGTGHTATNEWDVLARLAKNEGLLLWVDGKTLNLQSAADLSSSNSWRVAWTPPAGPGQTPVSNVWGLQFGREMTLAPDIKVTVLTHQPRVRKRHKVTITATKETAQTASGKARRKQEYVFIRPNMTPDQAKAFANAMLDQLSKHERRIDFSMPGEFALSPRGGAILAGTGTAWDQSYFVVEIDRDWSVQGGFVQRILAKNQSPAALATETETVDDG